MKTFLSILLLAAASLASTQAASLNGSDYEVVIVHATWDEARADAETRGGHLVTPQNDTVWSLVKDLVNNLESDIPLAQRGFPLGIVRDTENKTHVGITGIQLSFFDWAQNSPNFDLDFGDWVYASGGLEHRWNTPYGPDFTFELYVLEKPSPVISTTWNGHYYEVVYSWDTQFGNVFVDWGQPTKDASSRGGHIVTIASAEEEDAVRELWSKIPDIGALVGAESWMDGNSSEFSNGHFTTHWDDGESSTWRTDLLGPETDYWKFFLTGLPMRMAISDQVGLTVSPFYILEIDPKPDEPEGPLDSDGDGLTDEEEKNTRHSYELIQAPEPVTYELVDAGPPARWKWNGGFSFEQCKQDAAARGGHVATMENNKEIDFIRTIKPWVAGFSTTYFNYTPLGDGRVLGGGEGEQYINNSFRADGHLWSTYLLEIENSTDPNNPDTDNDGLTDGEEVLTYFTDPLNEDTDKDGLSDGGEVKFSKTNPLIPDTDGDGLTDGAEALTHHTNPLLADTDGDGFSDGFEIDKGTNPLDPASQPVAPVTVYPAIEVEFPTITDQRYQMQFTTDFKTWTNLGDPFWGNGQTMSKFVSAREQASFLRVAMVK